MAKTKSMTRHVNHDDATSRKRFRTCENDGVTPSSWLDLNDDMLFLVIMQLGVVDFIAFGGVCKSWRSLALSNRKRFMASRPPISMCVSTDANEKECFCYLEDFEGRKFKTLLPHSSGRICVGLTCGYFVLFGRETNDFWLVNPITRHQLHFPSSPRLESIYLVRAILVFSPSLFGWVLVVINRFGRKIWFSVAGEGAWNHVSTIFPIVDLYAFKGKIYTLGTDWCLCEMKLGPKPKMTFLTNEYYWKPQLFPPTFASSGEHLYVVDRTLEDPYIVLELGFGEMKWVSPREKTIKEYVFFLSDSQHGVVINPESWSQYKSYDCFLDTHITTDVRRKGKFLSTSMWYFPHLCLDVDILDEI